MEATLRSFRLRGELEMEFKTIRISSILAIAALFTADLSAGELAIDQVDPVAASYVTSDEVPEIVPLENVSALFEESDAEPAVPEVITVGLFQNLNPAAHCNDIYSCLRDCCELPRPEITGCLSNCCDGLGVMGWFGNNAFKGISDQGAESNFGVVSGINLAASPGKLADRGIGVQFGGSYGIYDFSGRTASITEQSSVQEQIFLTFGAFHRAQEGQRVQGGFVYDMMINDNWGTYSNEPFLTQWRAQAEYLLSDWNAVGLSITRRDHGASQLVGPAIPGAIVHFRPVSQVNLFFHHRWDNVADSYLWLGIPEKQRPGN
ncbi:MAG: hypothetical protein KDA36_10930, partial [Planctomycetaceae bacterium]|nr:hypothetical protein [Planctomycetaceae bacterium]